MSEAYDKLKKQLDDKLKADVRLTEFFKKIKNRTADLSDTAEYSQIVSKHISEVVQDNIGSLTSRLAKEMVCKELLKDHYERMNDVLAEVQAIVDEKLDININPIKAKYPNERVHKVAHSLEDPTALIETIIRRAGAPVENVANSFHDDYVKENARFRSDAGIQSYIVRTTDGDCCKWCTKMAGRYKYGEEPEEVYHRHDNCGCKTIYENGRQRQDVWTKKTWEEPEIEVPDSKPKIFTPEEAKALEEKQLEKFKPLTNVPERGIMKSIDVDDFNTVTYGKDILPEVREVIINTMKDCEKQNGFVISEISSQIAKTSEKGTPVLQIVPNKYGLLRLNVNAEYLSGKSLDEIDHIFAEASNTVVSSLKEAVIHESGHALSITGKSVLDTKMFYDSLAGIHLSGISVLAESDGAECLAELEVLRSRGTPVSDELKAFYKKYMRREY